MIPDYLEAVGLSELCSRVRAAERVAGSECAVAGLSYRNRPRLTNELILGDRRQLIAPFTGAGMATAFASAAEALLWLHAYSKGDIDWDAARRGIRARLRRRLTVRMKTAEILHPYLLRPRYQSMMIALARANLLPFGILFKLLH